MAFVATAAIVTTGLAVGGAVASYNSKKEQQRAGQQAIAQQYEYDRQKYEIEQNYHKELVSYSRQLSRYGDKQLDFAREQREYAGEVYQTALANAQREQEFRDKEVQNKKLAATIDYNAKADAGAIMIEGAKASAASAISETLRTGSANMREVDRKAKKQEASVVAKSQSGITGGASKTRELIAARMERNRVEAQLKEGMKASILKTQAANTQLQNNTSLKISEAYRGLQAMLALEARPVAAVNGPQPIFAEKAPISPVTPVGPVPMQGVDNSGGNWAAIAAGISGASAGFSLGSSLVGGYNNLFRTSGN